MREASYGAILASKIEEEIGGKVLKLSDRSSLGWPDNVHIKDGVATFFETKINDTRCDFIYPWDSFKKDRRQFEICKRFSKYALVLFIIYCPRTKMAAVLNIEELESFKKDEDRLLFRGDLFSPGHGIERIRHLIKNERYKIHAKL